MSGQVATKDYVDAMTTGTSWSTIKPTNPLVGEAYFDQSQNSAMIWDGSNWVRISGATQNPNVQPGRAMLDDDSNIAELNTIMETLSDLQGASSVLTANRIADKLIMDVLRSTNVNPLIDAEFTKSILDKIDEVRQTHNHMVT